MPRKPILLPLLLAIAMLPAWCDSAVGAALKDVRIGEYDGFTRIVFELDVADQAPHFQPQSNGVLAVSFDDTLPRLKRKIPVSRSKHVQALKFWHRRGRLFTYFQFDFDHFRFETFPLAEPPRIVLDIHPLAALPATAADPESTPTVLDRAAPPSPATTSAISTSNPQPTAAVIAPEIDVDARPTPIPQPAANTATEVPQPRRPILKETDIESGAASAAGPDTDSLSPPSRPVSNRLQFYLVVILVVMTIVILALLLLMLLARHRWSDGREALGVRAYLKNQDERIASLDEQIQEQLKRYEEA